MHSGLKSKNPKKGDSPMGHVDGGLEDNLKESDKPWQDWFLEVSLWR